MKIDHRTTILLETEAEREHFQRAMLVLDEMCNAAIRTEQLPAEFIRAGVDDLAALKRFQEVVRHALYSM